MKTIVSFLLVAVIGNAAASFADAQDTIFVSSANAGVTDTIPSVADSAYWKNLGKEHARHYFREYTTGAGLGAFACGASVVLFPAAVMIYASPPKEKNLNYPDNRLWENKTYRMAYEKKAVKIKRGRVLKGYFAGLSTAVIIGAIIISTLDFNIQMDMN